MSNQTARRAYTNWIFINRDGTPYDMPADGCPRCCYALDTYGSWYWFKKTGEDRWFGRISRVPKHIQMAAILLK